MSNFDSLVCNDTRLEINTKFTKLINAVNYNNTMDNHLHIGKLCKKALCCRKISNSQSTDYNTSVCSILSTMDTKNKNVLANQLRLSPNKTRVIRNKYPTVIRGVSGECENSQFMSQQLRLLTPLIPVVLPVGNKIVYSGDTFEQFTYANVTRFDSAYRDYDVVINTFKSQSFKDIMDVRLPDAVQAQITNLSNLMQLVDTTAFSGLFDAKLMHKMADIGSSLILILTTLSHECSYTNILTSVIKILCHLELPLEQLNMCREKITEMLRTFFASIRSFTSQSMSIGDIDTTILRSFFQGSWDLLSDEIVVTCTTFIAKLAAFWATIAGGFDTTDFKLSSLPILVEFIQKNQSDVTDIVIIIGEAYSHIINNLNAFFKGDFSSLLMGKTSTKTFEIRVTRVNQMYKLVSAGAEDVLKDEFKISFVAFDIEVAKLIKLGDRMITKAKDAQKPALKRILDELRQIQVERIQEKAEIQTKIAALGICFVGGSGVGKSFLTERTAKVLISAYGETPSKDLIVTGSLSEKFDSNELPRHLIIQYDDVANNSNNENYDKLLNAVNPQSRPFIKAGVEEKGKMFPGNIGCIISTNVPGLNAVKMSNCPDSICRRFLHIEVRLKESADICEEGTRRIDPTKAVVDGKTRMDIWEFHVYQFVTFDPLTPEMSKRGIKTWEGMQVLELKWTEKSLEDQTYWDLAQFLAARARTHFEKQRSLLATLNDGTEDVYCQTCNIPESICTCGAESQFLDALQMSTLQRLNDTYTILNDYRIDVLNQVKFCAAVRVMTRNLSKNLIFTGLTTLFSMPVIMAFLAGYNLSIIEYLTFMIVSYIGIFIYVFARCFAQIKKELSTRDGVLTFLADETSVILRKYRDTMFAGSAVILFFLSIYKIYKPKSQFLSFTESQPEVLVSSTKLSETSRTTTVEQLTPHVKKDLGVLTVFAKGKTDMCLVFPIKGNMFMTVNHMLPEEGDVDLMIEHEDGAVKTVARQKICQHHISRNKDKDMAIFYVPSAVPRKEYLRYFPGDVVYHTSVAVSLITKDLFTKRATATSTRLTRKFGYGQNYIRTDKANLYCPYQYLLDTDTQNGMCMSVIMDYERSIIYGFHVAGNGKTGLMTMLSNKEINSMIDKLDVFPAVSRGELYMGNNVLSHGLGFIEAESTDESVNLPIENHNLQLLGVLAGAGATFKDPFKKSMFYKDIVQEFGLPNYAPPQEINSVFHKRKALSKLAQPCQQFDLRSVERASQDYLAPILTLIDNLPSSVRAEIALPLNISQALDGIGITSLGGLNNSTSNGFPFRGKKRDFLARDDFDINIAKYPRELVTKDGVDIQEIMELFKDKYLNGESSGMVFKCSMKCNELLSIKKVKARVFMGCNFPFLLLCRMYFKPFMQLISANQHLFEAACGTDMNSIQAEEMYTHLTKHGTEHIVALDYSAFDQTMSAQVSTAASKIILDILQRLGCSSDHCKIAAGLLTDINYPVLHFFGTMIQLANSNPSGQPLTTQLNGIVNSLYLRIFFYDLYPKLPRGVTYRDVVTTLTYGDDNINGVHKDYLEFNGLNIVEIGKKYGLNITMAAKDDEIVAFTDIKHSGFLKRNFRFDESIGHIVAMMEESSILKAVHWFKKGHPQGERTAFAEKADGMMRNARSISRPFFEDIKGKLYNIAKKNDFEHIITWYDFDELSIFVKDQYYTNYRPGFYYPEFEFESQALSIDCPETTDVLLHFPDVQAQALYIITHGNEARDPCMLIDGIALKCASLHYFLTQFTRFSAQSTQERLQTLTVFLSLLKRKDIIAMHRLLINHNVVLVPYVDEYVFNKQFTSQSLTLGVTYSGLAVFSQITFIIVCIFLYELYISVTTPIRYTHDLLGAVLRATFTSSYSYAIKFILPVLKPSGVLMQVNKFKVQLRYIRVGRAQELALNEQVVMREVKEYILYLELLQFSTFSSVFASSAIARAHAELLSAMTDIELETTNEVIREQPFAVALVGPPGVGKTALALALTKAIMVTHHTFSMDKVVIMNETDQYQSEFRTSHEVVIFDDVANSHANASDTMNPLRKLIDFINNVPKCAISPFLELKGIVKIRPKLVMVTTNIAELNSNCFSQCPESIMRRFIWIEVCHPVNAPVDYSSLNFNHLKFKIKGKGFNASYGYAGKYDSAHEFIKDTSIPSNLSELLGEDIVEEMNRRQTPLLDYQQLVDIIIRVSGQHYDRQRLYVNSVNDYLTQMDTDSRIASADEPIFKSQSLSRHAVLRKVCAADKSNDGKPVKIIHDYGDVIYYTVNGSPRYHICTPQGFYLYEQMDKVLKFQNCSIGRPTTYGQLPIEKPVIYSVWQFMSHIYAYFTSCFWHKRQFKSQTLEVGLTLSTATSISEYYTDRRLDNLRALKMAHKYLAQDSVRDQEYDLYLACIKDLGFSTAPILREWNMPGQPMYKNDLVLYDSFYDVFIVVEYKRELKFSRLVQQVYRATANFMAVTHAKPVIMLIYCNSTGFIYMNHTGVIRNILTVLRHYKAVYSFIDDKLEVPSMFMIDNYSDVIAKAQKDFNICKNMQKIRTNVA